MPDSLGRVRVVANELRYLLKPAYGIVSRYVDQEEEKMTALVWDHL